MHITRRQLLKFGTCTLAGMTLARPVAAAAARKIPVALGLWSVREEAAKDLERVLGEVAEMGYTGVELAHSDYGHSGATWRKILDRNGLKACGMHTLVPKLEGDNFRKMIDFQQAVGNRYLILAAVPKKGLSSLAGLMETAKLFDSLADKLKPFGMRIGYHCHGGDFQPAEGKIPWVVLGENTRPEVIMQLDIGNCLGGGGDYLAMLKKFASRATTVHLKDYGGAPGFVLGEGKIQFNDVFQVCESGNVTEWYIVEEESRKGPESLKAVRRCRENLKKMGR